MLALVGGQRYSDITPEGATGGRGMAERASIDHIQLDSQERRIIHKLLIALVSSCHSITPSFPSSSATFASTTSRSAPLTLPAVLPHSAYL